MVTIGNGCKGVSIYCEGQDEINIPWKDIVKISYKKDKFRIIYYVPDRVSIIWNEHTVSCDVVRRSLGVLQLL